MRHFLVVLVVLGVVGAGPTAHAGWRQRQAARPATPMVTPNGTVVPAWAARRIAESPVPLYAPSASGRRPWAYPLAHQATPSALWARASQLGFGAGPVPGYTNGPGLGNIASMPMGPTGAAPFAGRGIGYPFNTAINGY